MFDFWYFGGRLRAGSALASYRQWGRTWKMHDLLNQSTHATGDGGCPSTGKGSEDVLPFEKTSESLTWWRRRCASHNRFPLGHAELAQLGYSSAGTEGLNERPTRHDATLVNQAVFKKKSHAVKCKAFTFCYSSVSAVKVQSLWKYFPVSLKKFKFYMPFWFKCNQTEYGCVRTTKGELLCAK